MGIKTKRNLGGIAIFVCIVLTVWMMLAFILPQYVMSGNDIISFLLLIVLFGVVGLYLIFSTINNVEIKYTVMDYSVRILSGIYIGVLLYVMILSRLFDGSFGRVSYEYNLIPLKSIINMISMVVNKSLNSGIMIENFIGNILMFLPMVVFINVILKGKYKEYTCLGVSFAICIVLEMVQCLTYCGAFDIDDILLNTTGMIIGYLLTKMAIYKKVINKLYLSNKTNCE